MVWFGGGNEYVIIESVLVVIFTVLSHCFIDRKKKACYNCQFLTCFPSFFFFKGVPCVGEDNYVYYKKLNHTKTYNKQRHDRYRNRNFIKCTLR